MSPTMRSVDLSRRLLRTSLPVARRVRLIITAGTFLVACVGTGACLLAIDLRDNTIRNTERDLRGLTMLEAEQADRTLMAAELVGDDITDRLLAQDTRSEQQFAARAASGSVRRRLEASLSGLPQVVAIGITDSRGKLLSASRTWPASDADLSESSFFRRLVATVSSRTIAAVPIPRNGGLTMMLYVSRKVLGDNGRTLGFVLSAIDMRYFERLYASVASTDADVISIVTADRTMLARHPSPPGAVGQIVPPVPGLRRSPGDPEGSGVARMITPIDERNRLIAIRPLDHYPLIVGASRTVDAALVVWHRQIVALGLAIAISITALLSLLWSSVRRQRDRANLARAEAARSAAEARAAIDHRLARQDLLTGLPNRLVLDEALRRLPTLAEGRRHATLLLLDLDGFKRVNDLHGHPCGDALLRAVADRLRRTLDKDDLLVRLGGDEFAIVCGIGDPTSLELRTAKANALADRIVTSVGMPFLISGQSLTIGTSIGIAIFDDADRGMELLLRDADIALYRAKAMGRGTWSSFTSQQADLPICA